MRFIKMHGLGNDYLFLNCLSGEPDGLPDLTRRMSDRRFGVGSDGVICLCPSEEADFRMRMFNADGSEGAMCGNGLRCLAKYIRDQGLSGEKTLRIETKSGIRETELLDGEHVRVDMGPPRLSAPLEVSAAGRRWRLTPVSMGNPHVVVFSDAAEAVPVSEAGPALARHPDLSEESNVEFVQVLSRRRLRMRVWERGSGETMACGTGACAALAAAASAGLTERAAQVELPGGILEVCWDPARDTIFLTGPAVAVCEGDYFQPDGKEKRYGSCQ